MLAGQVPNQWLARLRKEGGLGKRGPLKHPTPSIFIQHVRLLPRYGRCLQLTPPTLLLRRRSALAIFIPSPSSTGLTLHMVIIVPRLQLTLSVSPITWQLYHPYLYNQLFTPSNNTSLHRSHTFVLTSTLPRHHGASRPIFLSTRLFVRPCLSS
jgi:hypothetical protein